MPNGNEVMQHDREPARPCRWRRPALDEFVVGGNLRPGIYLMKGRVFAVPKYPAISRQIPDQLPTKRVVLVPIWYLEAKGA